MMRRLIMLGIGVTVMMSSASRVDAQMQSEPSGKIVTAVGRARGLMDGGDGAAARALLDSLVKTGESGTTDLAEVLYWRAALAERTSDTERDLKRLVVDIPLSPRVPDALLRLGDIDIMRGRPATAREGFQRIVRDFADAPQRPKAMLWIVRSYFEERDIAHACEAVAVLRNSGLPDGELKLQADEYALRCATIAAAANPQAPNPPAPTAGTLERAARETKSETKSDAKTAVTPEVKPEATSTRARFTVQLAAYDTRSQAAAVVKRFAKRNLKARIDGERKPFRVRIGRYETRAEAAAALARLKKQGHSGFVAELER